MYTINDTSRSWAEIDLSALKHNLGIAKSCGKRVMCVIKANAYGHGAVECGKFLEKNGADAFAVACLQEALELRSAGITLPILILGYTPAEYASVLSENRLEQTLVDREYAEELNASAKAAGCTVAAHIKLDTGMSRSGLLAQGADNIAKATDDAEFMYRLENIDVTGIYTHMSVADTPSEDDYTAWQIQNFNAVIDNLSKRGITIKTRHMSNSAGIMEHPEAHFDMVREGIMLYGLYPDSMPREGALKPVMTLKARVGQVRELPEGTTVSYGRTYKADKPIKTAVVTIGYADGYPRRVSNNAYAVINGRRYRQIGRVCMDMIMLDVTGSDVKRGDAVTLFGEGGMTVEEVSQIVGTINYELTCLVTPRAKRIYINGEAGE